MRARGGSGKASETADSAPLAIVGRPEELALVMSNIQGQDDLLSAEMKCNGTAALQRKLVGRPAGLLAALGLAAKAASS